MQISGGEAIRIFLASCPRLRSSHWQDLALQHSANLQWRIGGQDGITADNVILIGLINVSQGSWKPILQLNRYIIS